MRLSFGEEPGIKRWLQNCGLPEFADQKLAWEINCDELPKELHDVCQRLAIFTRALDNPET